MNRQSTWSIACLSALLLAQQALPSFALRPPIGALVGSDRFLSGITDKGNQLYVSPALLQLAKFTGRIGLSPGLFMEDGSIFTTQPGINLRSLLLYQAGFSKLPSVEDKNGRAQSLSDSPTLTLEPVGEANTKNPLTQTTVQPESESVHLAEVQAQDASASKPKPKHHHPAPELVASSFETDDPSSYSNLGPKPIRLPLEPNSGNNDDASLLAEQLPAVALSLPASGVRPDTTAANFRFWTWRPDNKVAVASSIAGAQDSGAARFSGSFVLSTPSAISSITGREFTLSPGKVLASNQGSEMMFSSELATVTLPAHASASLEVSTDKGTTTLTVLALETGDDKPITVATKSGATSFKLIAGHAYVISNRSLPASLAGFLKAAALQTISSTSAQCAFDLAQYANQELEAAGKSSADQQELLTLDALKTRLSTHR